MSMARSDKAADRQRAFEIFQAWIRAAPILADSERLHTTERIMLEQIFAANNKQQRR